MTGRPVFRIETSSDGTELRLVGELDLDGSALLHSALAECLARRPPRVLLDLWNLGFCDCAGLNVLLEARAAADTMGVDLCLEGACAQVARLFALAGADTMFAGGGERLPPRTV